MSAGRSLFLHALIFDCPRCGNVVASRTLSTDENRESVDATTLNLYCVCGWTGKQLGLRAREHTVQAWAEEKTSSV